MQLSNIPGKLVLPFANAGGKSTIPVASQIGITAGAASLTDGFPPLTRTPIAAGGVPPSGLDMNGILYEMSAIIRWANAGGGYPYDGTFAADTNVVGYPKGARIMRSDGTGYWFNTVENNVTDPEVVGAAAAGWVPDYQSGATSVAMSGSSVTLTPNQYGKPLIVITGTLSANLNLIFPAIVGEWVVINGTSGPFTITAKTASGTGVIVGSVSTVICDATNIKSTGLNFIKTSDFSTLASAASAAVNKTLIVDSNITIASDLVIPATVSLEFIQPGFITVNSGVTLTISGQLTAEPRPIFGGAGAVVFTSSSRAISPSAWFGAPGAVFNTARNLVQNSGDPGGPVHAFEDDNTLTFTYPLAANYNAYAAYDANTIATGPGDYDHMVAFQARQTYNGSGSIWSRWDAFDCLNTHSGTGTVATMRGFRMENPLGSGPITTLHGFHCEELTRGATNIGYWGATPFNSIQTGIGKSAQWNLCGNGQAFNYGLVLQSDTNSDARVRQTANRPLYFGANNVDTAMITPDGRFKIGTLVDLVGSGNVLDILGTNGVVSKISSGLNPCYLNWSAATAGDNVFQSFYTEASITQRGSIDYNRVGGAVRYNTTSDKTLKTRIGPAPVDKSLEILNNTVLEEYFWNEDPNKKPQIGPFAQDLQKVFKGAVSEGGEYEEDIPEVTEQRLLSGTVENGDAIFETIVVSPARKETRYRPWGVDKTAFTFHLIAGYKYQKAQIESLEARLSKLEALLAQGE